MQKKILYLLILLQVLLLSFSIGNYLLHRNDAYSTIYTTDAYQLNGGKILNNRIVFMESDGSGQYLLLKEALPQGLYHINIRYSTNSKNSTICAISTDLSEVDLHSAPLILDYEEERGTLTLELDRSTSDLGIYLNYKGDGLLNIHQISIQENSNYYAKKIVCTVGFCVLLSFGYFFYLSDSTKRSIILALTAIFLISCYPLTTDYLMAGHDLPFHLMRIEGIYQGLAQGTFPVKIHPVWARDYGYAVGVFYGDLFLYVPAVLRLLGFSVQESLKLFVVFVNLGTVLTSYFCFRRIFSSRKAGLIGSALYTLSLYRLSDVYTRASLGEYTALMCLPLILCGFYLIYTEDSSSKKRISHAALTAFGLTGVIQSHILSVEMVALFILLTCIILVKKTLKLSRFLTLATAVLFSVLLNLGFLVPFFSYFNDSININSPDWGIQAGYSIQNMGMYPVQLLGVMNRANGGTWATTAGVHSEAAYSLGIVLTICTCLFLFFGLCHPHAHKDKHYKPALLCCILGILALYMCTCYFPWDTIAAGSDTLYKLVSTLQFPWRFLSIATILLCMPACYVIVNLKKLLSAQAVPVIAATLAVLLLISCGWYYYDFVYTAEPYRVYDTGDLNSMALYSCEYLPTGTDTSLIKSNTIYCDEHTVIDDFRKKGTAITVCVTSSNGGTIDFPLNYYRDYVCTNLSSGATLPTEAGYNNMVRVTVPDHFEGQLYIRFREPITWRIAETISLLSCLAITAAVFYPTLAAVWKALTSSIRNRTQEKDAA